MILATVALALALHYTRNVMIPFILAIFITTVVAPLVDVQVTRWRFPSWIAVATTLSLVLVILILMSVVLIIAVETMVHAANDYSKQAASLTSRLFEELHSHGFHVDQSRVTADLKSHLRGLSLQRQRQ